MATTLKIQSFSEGNITERTELKSAVVKGGTVLAVRSSENYATGDVLYVGTLSRERCEKATILSVGGSELITLTVGLQYDHGAFEPASSVIGEFIRIYRAVNVDGSVPAEEMFSSLTTRTIDPDQTSTYYTDSGGSSAFWYRSTYVNAAMTQETPLSASQPVRGDDFGHYATLSAIRTEAGFQNAHNLSDVDVDQQRRAAEAEINSSLGSYLTVPFVKPMPDIIRIITEKLAAGFLWANAYREDPNKEGRVVTARQLIKTLQTGEGSTGDDLNIVASGVSGYPNDDGPRMFSVEDIY